MSNYEAELRELDKAVEDYELPITLLRQEAINIPDQIQALRDEFNRKLAELEDNRYRAGDMIRRIQNKKRTAQTRKADVLNLIEAEKENERREAEKREGWRSIDERTANAKWRLGIANGDKAMSHQIEGAHFVASGKRVIIADSMGVGKTLTSIAALDMLDAKRVLVIAPGEVMTGFVKEFNRWSDRPAVVIGKKPKKIARMLLEPARMAGIEKVVYIINFESWRKDKALLTELESIQFDTIIVDEAHNIKEMDTIAYKGVEQIAFARNKCSECGSFCLKGQCTNGKCYTGYAVESVENLITMTGTPILNKPEDIFSLLHLVNRKIFHSRTFFLRQYCRFDYDQKKYVFSSGGQEALAAKLAGMYLRRTQKSAGIVLPPQDIIVHEIELDPEVYKLQAEILETLANDAAVAIQKMEDGTISASKVMMSILALITRQRQAATWPGGIVLHEVQYDEYGEVMLDENDKPVVIDYPVGEMYQESVKMDRAVELINEFVEDEQRVVVFSQFRTALDELQRRLESTSVRSVVYHGGTGQAVRERIKNNFDRYRDEKPDWDAVLCHFKTGGIGLNLTAATATIVLDEEWNPGKNEQAYDRTHRIGQTESTSIHILRLVDSVDTWMASLNDEKRRLVSGFNEANNNTELVDFFKKKLEGK